MYMCLYARRPTLALTTSPPPSHVAIACAALHNLILNLIHNLILNHPTRPCSTARQPPSASARASVELYMVAIAVDNL
jgi:hypothetical protein